MKQYTVRELSAALTEKVREGAFEITNRGEVIAVVYPKRKVRAPDISGNLKRAYGKDHATRTVMPYDLL